MEKFKDLPRAFGADSRNLGKVCYRRSLDCFQRAEVVQQRALARGADAFDFLQAGLANILGTALAMRSDDKTMGFVAQPLNEVEHRIARLELQCRLLGDEDDLVASVAIGPL